jgi:dual specificity phosphatase 3
MNLSTEQINQWHREVCEVTPWLYISGDLHPIRDRALAQLELWRSIGITDIVDVRGEWSDEALVSEIAPEIKYHYLGTHDDGTSQDSAWFKAGIEAMSKAFSRPDAKIMVHCHMGINRGPSMAFAMLVSQDWEPLAALSAIRAARPIAGIIYAEDALTAVRQFQGEKLEQLPLELEAIQDWFDQNYIDISTIIHKIRSAE